MPRCSTYSGLALAIGPGYAAELGRGGVGRKVASYLERAGIRPDWLHFDFESDLPEGNHGELVIRINKHVEVRQTKIGDDDGSQQNGYKVLRVHSNIFDEGHYALIANELPSLSLALMEGILLSIRSFVSMGLM